MVQMLGQAGTIMMPVAANGGMHQAFGSQEMMMIQKPLQQANKSGMDNNNNNGGINLTGGG